MLGIDREVFWNARIQELAVRAVRIPPVAAATAPAVANRVARFSGTGQAPTTLTAGATSRREHMPRLKVHAFTPADLAGRETPRS